MRRARSCGELGVARTTSLLLCFQQISVAVCAVAGLPDSGHLSSDSAQRRSRHPDSEGWLRTLNSTVLGNLTEQNHNAYCRDDPDWYGASGDLNLEDCRNTILSILDDTQAGTDLFTPFIWSHPGFDSRSHKFTPRPYISGDCVLSVWPRYLDPDGDDEIREAQPRGLDQSDMASLKDIGTLAFRLFDQCLVRREHPSAGWIPAGERSSLFVGFWERNSDFDDWIEDLRLSRPPVMNESVATA